MVLKQIHFEKVISCTKTSAFAQIIVHPIIVYLNRPNEPVDIIVELVIIGRWNQLNRNR